MRLMTVTHSRESTMRLMTVTPREAGIPGYTPPSHTGRQAYSGIHHRTHTERLAYPGIHHLTHTGRLAYPGIPTFIHRELLTRVYHRVLRGVINPGIP